MNKSDKRKLEEFYCYLKDIEHCQIPISTIVKEFDWKFLGYMHKEEPKNA